MTIEVYTIPGSCSDAVDFLLNYLELDYSSLPRARHRQALEALNPSASVPTLTMPDCVLTESGAILLTLAEEHAPELLGRGKIEKQKVLELTFFLNTTFYQAFIPYFRPDKFAASEAARGEVRERALKTIGEASVRLRTMIEGSTSAFASGWTICDFLLPVYLGWLSSVSQEILHKSDLAELHRNLVESGFVRAVFDKRAA